MISSDQGNSEKTHFLYKWILTSKLILHKDINIVQVEMDYSWPLMHSTCLAFNEQSMTIYLSKCWEIVNCKTSAKLNLPTVLHLCSAHIVHSISYKLDKNYKFVKRPKRLVLHACGTMVKSTNIDEINIVFESLCIFMTTESMLPLVTKSLLDLESIVKGEVIINSSVNTFIDDSPENLKKIPIEKFPLFGDILKGSTVKFVLKFY